MSDIEKVIDGLEKAKEVIEAWIPMFEQHNSPFTIDCAIELLKDYKQHLQNDLVTLKEEKQGLEIEHKAKAFIYPQPHPCKECDKYGCDVHCLYYGK